MTRTTVPVRSSDDETAAEIAALIVESGEGPFEDAWTTPPAAFRCEELYKIEREHILRQEWHAIGFASEIPEPGDYFTLRIAEEPIIALRTPGGGVQAYPNVCLHRLSVLLDGSGSLRRIQCPYHGWTYDLDGRLVAAPYMDRTENFDPCDLRLNPLRTEVFSGVIFVSLAPDIEPVASRLAEFPAVVDGFNLERHVPVQAGMSEFDTNWKLFQENFIESYHTFRVHPQTFLPSVTPLAGMEFSPGLHDQFTWHILRATSDSGLVAPADRKGIREEQRNAFIQIGLFPSAFVAASPTQSFLVVIQPEGVRRTIVRYAVAVAPDVLGDTAPEDYWADNLEDQAIRTLAEDQTIVNRMSLDSRFAARSRLSYMERPLWEFHRYMARQYRRVPGLLDGSP